MSHQISLRAGRWENTQWGEVVIVLEKYGYVPYDHNSSHILFPGERLVENGLSTKGVLCAECSLATLNDCITLTFCSSASAMVFSRLTFSVWSPILAIKASASWFLCFNSASCEASLAFRSSTCRKRKNILDFFFVFFTSVRCLYYIFSIYVSFICISIESIFLSKISSNLLSGTALSNLNYREEWVGM